MKTPCELVVGRILPTLRASVVRELSGKYRMKQSEIAKKLGITQASVSQYLSATRGGSTKMLEDFPQIVKYADEIAKRIVAGETKYQWYGVLCKACKEIREDEHFCRLHRVSAKLSGCDICKKQ
jgi:predicted transcriptional regulator